MKEMLNMYLCMNCGNLQRTLEPQEGSTKSFFKCCACGNKQEKVIQYSTMVKAEVLSMEKMKEEIEEAFHEW